MVALAIAGCATMLAWVGLRFHVVVWKGVLGVRNRLVNSRSPQFCKVLPAAPALIHLTRRVRAVALPHPRRAQSVQNVARLRLVSMLVALG